MCVFILEASIDLSTDKDGVFQDLQPLNENCAKRIGRKSCRSERELCDRIGRACYVVRARAGLVTTYKREVACERPCIFQILMRRIDQVMPFGITELDQNISIYPPRRVYPDVYLRRW